MMTHPLTFPEREIRRHGPGAALPVVWRQWRTETALARRGVRYRSTDPHVVAAAYAAMSPEEFDLANARQDWANWRTIPRALSGRLPDRPWTVCDLGCGTGGSTQVLAFYAPDGSTIYGYELAEPIAGVARRRHYRHRSGKPAAVTFLCQGVTETWRSPDGLPLADGSVDLVNASGVVGHHLRPDTVGPLIAELDRVLKSDGVAMLDVGPTLNDRTLSALMAQAGFRREGHYRSCLVDLTGEVVYRRG
jgi:SAM-dependent methyltransferase